MPIVYLHDYPHFFPLAARWIWEEWRHLLAQSSCEEFECWLRTGVRVHGLPTTLLWLEDGEPVATVSLESDDMEIRPELSPWLASLYVLPSHRGRGLGRAMVRAAEEEASALGVAELYLYTPAHERFYLALGWETFDRCNYRETSVTIMRRGLRPASASPRSAR
jgi:GNAT superfamily N-acetyltransferase